MIPITAAQVQYLTLAYFGRPADPASLSAWPATGLSASAVVLRFVATDEYKLNTIARNTSGNTLDQTGLINTYYNRLFGRNAAASEVAGWTSALATGAVNVDYLGITILNAGLNLPATTDIRQVLTAKFDSAQLYTGILFNNPNSAAAYNGTAAIANGIAYQNAVTTSTPATFAQAQTSVNALPASGTGGQTFTLTTSQLVYTGTVGDDTFVGFVDRANAANSTFTAADQINGSSGVNTLQVTIAGISGAASDLAAALTTNIQQVQIRNVATGAPAVTVNANNFVGLTQALTSGTAAVLFTNLAAAAVANVVGDGSSLNASNSFTYGTGVSTATLNLVGGLTSASNSTQTVDGTTALTSLTVNSTGAANALGTGAIAVGAGATALKTVTINATTNLTATGGVTGVAASSTLNVTGAGAVSLGNLVANFTTVNASTNSGGLTAGIGAAAITLTGGTGNDVITTNSIALTGTVSGGTGVDRLNVTRTADITAVTGLRYSGFEVLGATSDGVTALEVDASFLAANNTFTAARLTGSASDTSIINLTAAAALDVTVTASGAGVLTANIAGATGAQIDTLNLKVDDGSSTVNTIALGAFTSAGLENLSIAATDNYSLLTGNLANLSTLTLTGAGTQNITYGAIAINNGLRVIGAAATGALTITLAAGTGANGAAELSGGSANDSLTGTINGDNINGNAGNDTITGGNGADLLTGGAGNDTFRYTTAATSVGAAGIRTDVITDFTNGTDTIGLQGGGGAGALLAGVTIVTGTTTAATTLSNVADATSVANIAAVYTAIAANTSFNAANFVVSTGAAGGLVNRTITFTSGAAAGTYLVINDGTTAGFDAADLVIGLGNAANPVAFSAAAITTFA